MSFMSRATPEQKAAMTAKSLATRQRNIAIRRKEEHEAKENERLIRIKQAELDSINAELSDAKVKLVEFGSIREGMRIDFKSSMSEVDIVRGSSAAHSQVGVYFLIKSGRIVYVGQSVQVATRIESHKNTKDFDSFSFITCDVRELDYLESFYIFKFSPPLNGRMSNGAISAPLSFDEIAKYRQEVLTDARPVNN